MRISFPGRSSWGSFEGGAPSVAVLTILYRTLLAVICIAGCVAPAVSVAQEDRPEIVPLERQARRPKKDLGPRALALLQMTANGKVTLVPVAIMINGKFYDAAAYKASPVPMALDAGTVYEGERSGSPIGLFTINGALHSEAVNVAVPWLGTGTWLAAGSEPKRTGLKAEKEPIGIETTDAPPRLTRGGEKSSADKPTDSSAPTTSPTPSTAPAPTTPPTDSAPSAGQPPSTTSAPPSASTRPASKPDTKPEASPQSKRAPPASDSGSSSGSSADQSQSGDEYRPRLRRGKPPQAPSDDDIPGYSRVDAKGASKPKTGDAKDSAKEVKQTIDVVPAISDANGPDPRSYAFQFDKPEADERNKQMTDLAKQQLRAYIQQSEKNTTSSEKARPAGTRPARKTAAKAPNIELENIQFRAFDLWANNQPVLVLHAEAQLQTPAPAGATAPPTRYFITVVARTDIYSNVHKLYAGITDKYHLDVTPQLDLIDAVDADGDGSGELLFRETSDASSGYIIYRPTADSLWKMYDSLNPE
ncbi:MAG TPA: hypothetical protein VFO39_23295 [Candidatus Sulfotelmatobacter sp.]|nr:hypothetical protein [Candidatus Sulfotelmatobacter sp.]